MAGGVNLNDYSSSSNLFWDIQKSGQSTSNFGSEIGLSTNQMIGNAATSNMVGLNYDTIFEEVIDGTALSSGIIPWRSSYPILKNIDPLVQLVSYLDPMTMEYDLGLGTGNEISLFFTRSSEATHQTIDAIVDWGDGTLNSYQNADLTQVENLVNHVYLEQGKYVVKIYGEISQFGPINGNTVTANAGKLTRVGSFGDIKIERLQYTFLNEVNLTDVPSTLPESVTTLWGLFRGASSINDPDISNWDVSGITSFRGLFNSASSFNQPLANWDLSNAVTTSWMFKSATNFNQDISTWQVSNVTQMASMFNGASTFDQNLSNWNVTSVTDMSNMFSGSNLSPTNYGNILRGWNAQSVQDDVSLGADGIRYYLGEDAVAREALISIHNWIIMDAGVVVPDQVVFFAPTHIFVNEGFVAGVQLFENSSPYPYTGDLLVQLASGSGNLSGALTQSYTSNVALFDSIIYDTKGIFQLEVTINYIENGENESFTSAASSDLVGLSNSYGGLGSGDDIAVLNNSTLKGRLANIWLGNSHDFSLANNWSLGTIPTSSDYLVVDSVATYPNIASANSFELATDGILNIESGTKLAVNGALLLGEGSISTTQGNSFIQIQSGASYLNQSASQPLLEIQRTVQGAAGWRMLSVPLATTFDDLFDQNDLGNKPVTQGYTGSDFPNSDSNVLWWEESQGGTTLQGWRQPNASTDSVQVGRGMFHYVFDGAEIAGQSGVFYTDELPVTYSVTGYEQDVYNQKFVFDFLTSTDRNDLAQDSTQGSNYIDRVEADKGWNLVGNPTASTLDWDLPAWDKSGISNTIYVWDATANNGDGDYLVWNGSVGTLGSGKIAPWQSFWVNVEASDPLLAFEKEAKILDNTSFVGKLAHRTTHEASEVDGKHLAATDNIGSTQDKSAKKSKSSQSNNPRVQAHKESVIEFSLQGADRKTKHWIVVSDSARIGLDSRDAFKLRPLGKEWLALYSKAWNESAAAMQINHVPVLTDQIQFYDLFIESQVGDIGGDYELSWNSDMHHSNAHIVLFDHVTDEMIPLDRSGSIRFEQLAPSTKSKKTLDLKEAGIFKDSLSTDIYSTKLRPSMMRSEHTSWDNSSFNSHKSKIGSVLQSQEYTAGGVSMNAFEGLTPNSRFTIAISATPLEQYLPRQIELLPNYPNPFNPSTNIQFRLPKQAYVELEVYSVLGQKVATLLKGELDAGTHTTSWNASRVASGVYFLRLRSEERVQTIKMTLIK